MLTIWFGLNLPTYLDNAISSLLLTVPGIYGKL